MVDGIERLRKINCEGGGAVGGFTLVETSGNKRGEGEEGGGGGVHGAETMLGVVRGQSKVKVGKDEALEHLRCRAEEGNGAVTTAEIGRFTGFGNREDDGLFPDIRDLRIRH